MVSHEVMLQGLNQLTNWGILTTDAALTITTWNQWLEVNSGKPAGDLVGRGLLEVFPELVDRRLAQFFRQALEGQVVLLSQRLHRYLLPMSPSADGVTMQHMQQSVRIAPLVDGERVVGTITVIEDVTERVASEAELAARAREQAAVAVLGQRALAEGGIATLLDEVATVTAEALGVEYCAIWEIVPGAQAMVLRSGVGWKDGTVGQATLPIGPGASPGSPYEAALPVIVANWNEETRFPAPPHLIEHGILSGMSVPVVREGHAFGTVSVYSRRERRFNEDHVHVLQAIANVLGLAIERKRLEAELRQRVKQLADADQRKDEFLAMLAHELRNPLAPIRNAVQLLRLKGTTAEELPFARDVIDRQLQHMTRLVDDLLDVSRITRGKVVLEKEAVDLATVVERAVEVSRPLIDARKHQLTVHLPPGRILVEADSVRLSQVIANLLNNAAKYTEEGGRIDLVVDKSEADAVIRVRDTGIGIEPSMLSSVFDLFTQAQGSVSRAEGGLGIGLSLVRTLVQMHGGTVTAFSAGLGRGSEFAVRLPLLKETATALSEQARALPRKDPGRRILVVDDNVDAAVSLALVLRAFGHDVRTAHDGPAALEEARAHRPEIVLLDIGLPRMSGLEVARRMRGDLALHDVLLVALTGYGQDEDRQRSMQAGFNGHMIKPVDFDTLQSFIARIASPLSGSSD